MTTCFRFFKIMHFSFFQIGIRRKNHIPPKFDLSSPTIEVSVDEGVEGVVLETVKATDDQGYRVQKVTYGLLQQAIPGRLCSCIERMDKPVYCFILQNISLLR